GYLTMRRQRKDFAAKTAQTLVQSHDLVAYEALQIANMVRNRRLAKGHQRCRLGPLAGLGTLFWRDRWRSGGAAPASVHDAGLQRRLARWDTMPGTGAADPQHADACLLALWAGARP